MLNLVPHNISGAGAGSRVCPQSGMRFYVHAQAGRIKSTLDAATRNTLWRRKEISFLSAPGEGGSGQRPEFAGQGARAPCRFSGQSPEPPEGILGKKLFNFVYLKSTPSYYKFFTIYCTGC